MRRAAKVDANQSEIVTALRQAGCTVHVTSAAGAGFPDIVVGHRGANFLLEIKDGRKIPSQQKLTSDQIEFHRDWRGQVVVVNSVEAAFAAVGIEYRDKWKSIGELADSMVRGQIK